MEHYITLFDSLFLPQGLALNTSLARQAPADQATATLAVKHSVEIIDEAKPGDVGVIVMEGSLDIAP